MIQKLRIGDRSLGLVSLDQRLLLGNTIAGPSNSAFRPLGVRFGNSRMWVRHLRRARWGIAESLHRRLLNTRHRSTLALGACEALGGLSLLDRARAAELGGFHACLSGG